MTPKCKQCSDLHSFKIGKKTFYDCYNPEVHEVGKRIYSTDIKTSPVWCPKKKADKINLLS
jgi:hypothetical protein